MINNVTLVGRLAKDPDLRCAQSGTAVGQFMLVINRNSTNANNEREADLINCIIWRKAAESLANCVTKGTLIGLTGRTRTRNYENQQGQRIYVTEVVAESSQLLEPREVNGQRKRQATGKITSDRQSMDRPDSLGPFSPKNSIVDTSDNDLPF